MIQIQIQRNDDPNTCKPFFFCRNFVDKKCSGSPAPSIITTINNGCNDNGNRCERDGHQKSRRIHQQRPRLDWPPAWCQDSAQATRQGRFHPGSTTGTEIPSRGKCRNGNRPYLVCENCRSRSNGKDAAAGNWKQETNPERGARGLGIIIKKTTVHAAAFYFSLLFDFVWVRSTNLVSWNTKNDATSGFSCFPNLKRNASFQSLDSLYYFPHLEHSSNVYVSIYPSSSLRPKLKNGNRK